MSGQLTPPQLGHECLEWAKVAGYKSEVDAASTRLVPASGEGTRYLIEWRRDRLRLTEYLPSATDTDEVVLYAATIPVLETFLMGVFGDDVRDTLALPFLELPWSADQLADGFELITSRPGSLTLVRSGHGPLAGARAGVEGLVKLVPLSHLLRWDLASVKASFLDPGGRPLLAESRYTR
ncbi:TNT antitoxin family protein [Mycobacterium hackensackense]|uniref:TNT antitoxin family protein n=1 Tax=Mycobacterium hackensackense TaxID=228909 RepID=UPI002265DCE3|nr:TNT antitoxin family protein [Mycobacterium hackensackense]MCV7256976.1 TNT antitoxin family protein [Mycobacterium hackensackense]